MSKCYLCGEKVDDPLAKKHKLCSGIATRLEALAQEELKQNDYMWDETVFEIVVYDYCNTFVCPHCENFDNKDLICEPLGCKERIYDRLTKYKLIPIVDWKEVKR